MHYKLVTADAHLEVGPDVWREYIPTKFRDRGPKIVPWHDGGEAWSMDGVPQAVPLSLNLAAGKAPTQWKFHGWTYDEDHSGTGDAAQRVKEMDEDGVLAAVEYPSVAGPNFYAQAAETDPEFYLSVIEAYNNFLSDFCMHAPERLWGIAIVPVTGVSDAIAELKRTREKPGLKGWGLSQFPSGNAYPVPEDDIFWAEAIKTKAPITAHVTFGGGMLSDPDTTMIKGNSAIMHVLVTGGAPQPFYTITQLTMKGVFDRFPDLRLHFAEAGLGWVPYTLEQADDRFLRHRFAEAKTNASFVEPKMLPSDYFRRHILLGFQIDHHGLASRKKIGIENITWGNAFPHSVGDWPYSQRVADEQVRDIPKEEQDLILWKNAADFYGVTV